MADSRDPREDAVREDAFMEASAALLGLTITEAHKPAIIENLKLIRAHIAKVMEFDLPDREEPAPVYRA